MEEEVLVVMALCHAAPAFRSLIGTTVGIGSQGILIDSTEEQKRTFLPRLARGDRLPVSTEAFCAKMFASEMCGRVADRAVQIFGGAGYMSEYAVERLYRDVRLFRIYEGTTQIQQVLIARNLMRELNG
jgi:alkylation response protein AidB-like acyl-CoA dehydrogenase